MGFHGGGWWSYIRYDEERDRPEVSRSLLRRVADYARPYWVQVMLLVLLIIVTALLSLIPPLLYRALIDDALPNGDVALLNLIALAIIGIAVLVGIIEVAQRFFSSTIRKEDQVGDILDSPEEELEELAAVETTLEAEGALGTLVPVTLLSKVTEVGTLQLWCVERDGQSRHKLEYTVRERSVEE